MTKISAFTIIISLLSLFSCSDMQQTVNLRFDDINVSVTVPTEFQETDEAEFKEGIVPYNAVFTDPVQEAFFGVFKGPGLNFSEADLSFYTDYIGTQYGTKYKLIDSTYGSTKKVQYFKFRQQSSLHGNYREFYLITTDKKKFSLGIEAKFVDENFSIESIVQTVVID